jgi:hypothetical protein
MRARARSHKRSALRDARRPTLSSTTDHHADAKAAGAGDGPVNVDLEYDRSVDHLRDSRATIRAARGGPLITGTSSAGTRVNTISIDLGAIFMIPTPVGARTLVPSISTSLGAISLTPSPSSVQATPPSIQLDLGFYSLNPTPSSCGTAAPTICVFISKLILLPSPAFAHVSMLPANTWMGSFSCVRARPWRSRPKRLHARRA